MDISSRLTRRLEIKITEDMYQWLKKQSIRFNKSIGDVARTAIMLEQIEDESATETK